MALRWVTSARGYARRMLRMLWRERGEGIMEGRGRGDDGRRGDGSTTLQAPNGGRISSSETTHPTSRVPVSSSSVDSKTESRYRGGGSAKPFEASEVDAPRRLCGSSRPSLPIETNDKSVSPFSAASAHSNSYSSTRTTSPFSFPALLPLAVRPVARDPPLGERTTNSCTIDMPLSRRSSSTRLAPFFANDATPRGSSGMRRSSVQNLVGKGT